MALSVILPLVISTYILAFYVLKKLAMRLDVEQQIG